MSHRPISYGILTLALVLSLQSIIPSLVAIYETGLQPGAKALYSLSGNYAENVTRSEMEVLTVSGSNITVVFRDLDGQKNVTAFWLDVMTGLRSNSSHLVFAVPTGLSPGNRIYQNPTITIQAEETFPCGGQNRATVSSNYKVSTQAGTANVSAHWDQNTGIFCDFNLTDTQGHLTLNMISTSLWSANPGGDNSTPPEAPSPLLIPALLVTALLVMAILSLAISKRRKH